MKKLILFLTICFASGTIGWLCSYQYYADETIFPVQHRVYYVWPDTLYKGEILQVTEYNSDHIKIVKK